MFIEISNFAIIALFFVLVFLFFGLAIIRDGLLHPKRALYMAILAAVLVALLVLVNLDSAWHLMV